MSYLQISNLSSGYNQTIIIRDFHLDVGQGDIFCILGRNGVGKTTLLNTIMGNIATMQGDVKLDGKPLTGLKPYQIAGMGVAFASQEANVFPDLSVEQNLKVGYRDGNVKFKESCTEAFEYFPILKERLKQPAGTLSGGEKKMLLMTRTYIYYPKLLLLDEITEGVQPSIIEKISSALKSLNKNYGTTVLMVEQNVDFAIEAADFYAVMNQGNIIEKNIVDSDAKKRIEEYLVI